jgi:hypothetical protein
MKLFIPLLLILAPLYVFSQPKCPVMPTGLLCISQEAGNRAGELARENPALKEKIAVLEQAIIDKQKNYDELKAVKEQNERDLIQANHKTEVQLASATGQIIQLEADKVRWTAVIDILIKNSRQKTNGIKIF